MAQILVVDDEMGIRELLSEILSDEGHSVMVAENASAARKCRSEKRPDLVLLDIWMPDTDGVSLLKEWSSSGLLTMPVVMMSGHGTIDSAVEATRVGAVDFLEKPIDHAKLMNAINEAFLRLSASEEKGMQRTASERLLASLTPREKEVMDLVVIGKHNREIAEDLGISARTVEVHKARMMTKLQVAGVPDLVRLSIGTRERD